MEMRMYDIDGLRVEGVGIWVGSLFKLEPDICIYMPAQEHGILSISLLHLYG